jgi:DNA-directed RNA polymerase subunit beta'
VKSKHSGAVVYGEGIEIKDVLDDLGIKQRLIVRSSSVYIKIKDKKEEYILPLGTVIRVKEGDKVETGETIAEYDPTYEYVVSSSAGRCMFMGLEVSERKKQKTAKRDGEVFIFNPKLKKGYEVPKDAQIFVKVGDKVKVGDEIAAGLICKAPGAVIEVKKNEVIVAPGESYLIVAGSRLFAEDGSELESYDVIARVEAIRRDPSKTRDIIQGLPKVEELFEARRPKEPAILSEVEGVVEVSEREGVRVVTIKGSRGEAKEYFVPYETRLRVVTNDKVHLGTQLTEGTVNPHDVLRILGVKAAQSFLVDEIQKIYRSQGVTISDKHIEVIVRQMTRKVRVVQPGDTTLLPGELIDSKAFEESNEKVKGEKAEATEVLLGITKASLSTDSFISAASFQETARILTDAAVKGKTDEMYGLKENVIIGKLIPAGTGFSDYRYLELVPTSGLAAQFEEALKTEG